MLQAAVDAHTVARIWRFLLDAHFITDRSRELHLRVPVLNRSAQIFSFWHLKISIGRSGRIVGRATINNTPAYSSTTTWSLFDIYNAASDFFLVFLTLLHTLFVSGLLAPCVNFLLRRLKPQCDDGSATATATHEQLTLPSRWFQLLCQISCVALTIGIIFSMWLNASSLRLADEFDTSNMRLPSPEYLPANVYQDLWSPARILMPGKVAETIHDAGECATAGNSRSSSLSVSVVNETPTWALETDQKPLDNLARMLVCFGSSPSCTSASVRPTSHNNNNICECAMGYDC